MIHYVSESGRKFFWVCAGVCCGFVGIFRKIAIFWLYVKPLPSPKTLVLQKVFLYTSLYVPTLGGAQNSQTYNRHVGIEFYKYVALQ